MLAMPETGRVTRPELVLASSSPQRRMLLEQVRIAARVEPPDFGESALPGEVVAALVERLAIGKARAVARGKNLTIGADTLVVLDGVPLGKAPTSDLARSMLDRLNGRTHEVLTGVAVVCNDQVQSAVVSTDVKFRKLDPEDIDWYLGLGEWRDKAGAYAIQGAGAVLVEGIDGDYTNVVGLPLVELDQLLAGFGRPLRSWAATT